MKKAYIFRGSSSSGKTTITKKFLKQLPQKVVFLELDNFRYGFHVENRKALDVAEEEHFFAYKNFLLMLESYCQNGTYDLVIEGVTTWDTENPYGNMQDVLPLLKKYNYDYTLFLLMADRETLWQRNTKRNYVVSREDFDRLYDAVMNKVGGEEIKVDVSKMTLDETIAYIHSQIGLAKS